MVCTSLGSLLHALFYFLCYIHFSLSVVSFHILWAILSTSTVQSIPKKDL